MNDNPRSNQEFRPSPELFDYIVLDGLITSKSGRQLTQDRCDAFMDAFLRWLEFEQGMLYGGTIGFEKESEHDCAGYYCAEDGPGGQ